MATLDTAAAQLNAVIEALERVAAPLVDADKQAKVQEGKVAELLRERELLLARLAELEEDTRALATTNEDIETRLDTAIGEIRAALGH
jgi:predicted phage-related endonuclease